MMNNSRSRPQCGFAIPQMATRFATILTLMTLAYGVWAQGNPNPRVLPPNSNPYGKSYAEWGAAWWQWALSIPAARNPVNDRTGGQFCAEGQSGPVWFLAGTFGFSTERSCTVPAGKALFFPVANTIGGAGVFDCEPTGTGPCDVDALLRASLEWLSQVDILEAEVDGVAVRELAQYVAISSPFALSLPAGAVFGLPEGTFQPNIAGGYWLMLAPLPPGQHTIRFRGGISSSFDVQVIYHLTIVASAERSTSQLNNKAANEAQ